MRGYRSQHRRWELGVVDRRECHTLQLCPGIRCRDGDGEDCWRLAVLSLDMGKGLGREGRLRLTRRSSLLLVSSGDL